MWLRGCQQVITCTREEVLLVDPKLNFVNHQIINSLVLHCPTVKFELDKHSTPRLSKKRGRVVLRALQLITYHCMY